MSLGQVIRGQRFFKVQRFLEHRRNGGFTFSFPGAQDAMDGMYVSPTFVGRSCDPQWDTTRRWGRWEGIRVR